MQSISLKNKLKLFEGHWQPRVVAEMNDYQFKLAKIQGDFVWHTHEHTDETFIVLKGKMRIDFRGDSVKLKKGDMFVVPKGVEHKPFAKKEAHIMIIEPKGVINTGDENNERKAENDVWI